MSENLRNWAGNYTYHAQQLHHPTSTAEVQEIVRNSRKLRVLGTRHSFNDIADSHEDMIALDAMNKIIGIDQTRRVVTVEAGVRYGELGSYLESHGFAVRNMASLPHISVVGACGTATHGSGVSRRNLAAQVVGMEIVNANGEIVQLSRGLNGDTFDGMPVHMGALGVITKITLALVPSFTVRQYVYEGLPLSNLGEHFNEIVSSAYSVSLFTNWQGDSINQVWLKQRNAEGPAVPPEQFYGATLAPADRHPIDGVSAENCTPQMGVAGPWHQRLPHFRLEFTPSNGAELQSEYFVPRHQAVAAFMAISQLRREIAPYLLVSEIRTIAKDELWMSPCYNQDSVGFHFTWKPDWDGVLGLLPRIETQLAPFDVRPHWGKVFTMSPEDLHPCYPRLRDFRRILEQFDPQGKFRNGFVDRYIFSD